MVQPLTIGTREDGLARAQAELFLKQLREFVPSYPVHLELVRPSQDRPIAVHVDHIAENRRSIQVLHQILRDGDCDLVIHRGFDLRDKLPPDLAIAAIPRRCSPYDALLSPCGITLDELDAGTSVGVVQLRARVQMLQYRHDLDWTLMSGDVATWLADLLDHKIEALVMPNAAIEQLGLQERVSEIFPADLVIPAPCSGILVCVVRREDKLTRERLSCVHHLPTAREYAAERSLMDALGCEWDSPVAALAQCKGRRLLLLGMVADTDGYRLIREGVEGKSTESIEVGEAVAELLERGLSQMDEPWESEALAESEAPEDEIDDELRALLLATNLSEMEHEFAESDDLADESEDSEEEEFLE